MSTEINLTDRLEPCPHCGSKANHYHRPSHDGWSNTDWVSCENEDCGAGTCLHETKEIAYAAWNRRAGDDFQSRVGNWVEAAFGKEVALDRLEHSERFAEEAVELVQAAGYPKERMLALIEYVYGRSKGEITQEVGGVAITLASFCNAHAVNGSACGEQELETVWDNIQNITEKWASKPRIARSPLKEIIETEAAQ